MTQCPKCGSERIAFAHDEAPAWAKKWTKCFACGKRWNLDGGPPKTARDTEEEAPDAIDDRPVPVKRTGEDIVKLVMNLSRQRKPGPKAKPISPKENTMARCTKGKCPEEAADDSVRCSKHRDEQRASNAKYQGRMLPDAGRPKRKYTRRQPLGGGTAVSTVPAKRANAPIVLADPTMVNATPARGLDLNGNAVTVLDAFIDKTESDLATLRGARDIMLRQG